MEINITRKTVVLVATALLLVGGGYYLYQRKPPTPPVTSPKEPSKPEVPVSENGGLQVPEGWKSYENKEAGYVVRYPTDWFLVKDGKGVFGISTVPEIGPLLGGLGEKDAIINIFTFTISQERLKELGGGSAFLEDRAADYQDRADYVKKVQFKGNFAIERMGKALVPTEPYFTLLMEFVRGTNLYEIQLLSLSKEGLLNHEPTFRKLLESFVIE